MTHLTQAFRAEADADERVAIALGHRDKARRLVAVTLRAERLRQSRGLREFAGVIGCSAAMLHDIEHGRRWSTALVYLVTEALGCLPTATGGEDYSPRLVGGKERKA